MRVLLDECVDWRLLRDLSNHDVKTVKQLGWEGVKNGELLSLASKQFDVFLTVDGNLPDQQHAPALDITVIVLHGRTHASPTFACCCQPFGPSWKNHTSVNSDS